jgi:acyl-CoA thioesterase
MSDAPWERSGVEPRFDERLGILSRSDGPGTCTSELELAPEHRNMEGWIHGGVFLSVLDTAMGHSIATLRKREGIARAATIQLSCQFLAPPRGRRVRAVGRVLRLGGRSAFVEGVLTDEAGTDVARAHGVWRVWRTEA